MTISLDDGDDDEDDEEEDEDEIGRIITSTESTPSNWKSGFIGSWKGSERRATRKSRCQRWSLVARNSESVSAGCAAIFVTPICQRRCCFRETISWTSSTRDTFHNYPLYYSNDKGLLLFSFFIFSFFFSL